MLKLQDNLDRHGFGFWTMEFRESGEFTGFTGLDTVDEEMPFTGIERACGTGPVRPGR